MKISIIQTDIAWNNPDENISRSRDLAQRALAEGGELLVFPEMFTTGFSMPTGDVAREGASHGLGFLSSLAREHNVHTLGSLPEEDPSGKMFNTAWLFSPDGSSASYRKMHLFSYGDETSRYSAGHAPTVASIGDIRTALFICYDLRFGTPFTTLAPRTDLFLIVANWPSSRREHWLTLLRARAIENQAYVIGVNRVGEGGGLHYSGDSVAYAPDGSELGRLSDRPATLTVEVQRDVVTKWRETFPALRDRRPDLY